MTAEEWIVYHGRYERYAKPIFNRALKESYANVLTMLPVINYENYKELIPQSFNYAAMNLAYVKVYSKVGRIQYRRTRAEIKRERKQLGQSDPEGEFMKAIYAWVQTNLGRRITEVNEYTIKLIQQLVEESINLNYSVSQMTSYLQRNLTSAAFTRMRALRIARTETTTAANYGAFKAADDSEVEQDKIWISVMDERTRHDHRLENGQKVPYDESFHMADGSYLKFPGDPKGSARQVINCRCGISFIGRRDNNGMLIFKN